MEYFYRKLNISESAAVSEALEGNEAKRKKGAFDGDVVVMVRSFFLLNFWFLTFRLLMA